MTSKVAMCSLREAPGGSAQQVSSSPSVHIKPNLESLKRYILFDLSVALAFAKRGANLHIAGRNADAASTLLGNAKSLCAESWPEYTEQVLQFHSFDASLISDNKRFANEMRALFEEKGGLDFLVMTQGGIGNGERKETAEGHEW